MLLLILLPLVLLWWLVAVHRNRIGFARLSVRGALVLAFLAYELLVLGVTEVTSIDHRFTAGSVAVAWGSVSVVLLVATRRPILAFAADVRDRGIRRFQFRESLTALSIEDRIWLVVVVAVFGTLVAVGSRYLPSNSDSLVYHLHASSTGSRTEASPRSPPTTCPRWASLRWRSTTWPCFTFWPGRTGSTPAWP